MWHFYRSGLSVNVRIFSEERRRRQSARHVHGNLGDATDELCDA